MPLNLTEEISGKNISIAYIQMNTANIFLYLSRNDILVVLIHLDKAIIPKYKTIRVLFTLGLVSQKIWKFYLYSYNQYKQ